jgi:RNA polymerase sigma-70 factor (ECF subfamily)
MRCDDPTSDSELVRRIGTGDEAALSALMKRYSTRVFTTAFRVLRQTPEAQEVTQDVFFAIWRHPERFDRTRGSLLTWLIILSRSRALDLLRSTKGNAGGLELTAEALDTNPALIEAFTPDRKLLIDKLMRRLPEEQGRVVQSCYIEGYAAREVAALLKLPLGTVKSRTRLALKKMRSELSGCKNKSRE